ncbi:hypothetical protein D3C72_897560 [compost metagenome]
MTTTLIQSGDFWCKDITLNFSTGFGPIETAVITPDIIVIGNVHFDDQIVSQTICHTERTITEFDEIAFHRTTDEMTVKANTTVRPIPIITDQTGFVALEVITKGCLAGVLREQLYQSFGDVTRFHVFDQHKLTVAMILSFHPTVDFDFGWCLELHREFNCINYPWRHMIYWVVHVHMAHIHVNQRILLCNHSPKPQ